SGSNAVTGVLTTSDGFAGPLLIEPGATVNWTGGTAAGPLTVESNAVLNLSGAAGKTLQNVLSNAGTITWTGTGGFAVWNNNAGYLGAIWNQPGAVFNIAADVNMSCACFGDEFFINQGTLEKTAATGNTYISVPVTNSGTVMGLQGTLNFNDGGNIA